VTTPFLVPILIVLAVIALGAVVLPLIRRGTTAVSTARFDRAVYRDQLQEVDRDLARGVLNPSEAGSARLEIERRLLATADADQTETAPRRSRRVMAVAIAVIVAVWATGFYMILGAPDVPDMPFASRAKEEAATGGHRDVEDAAARLEARLKSTGGDADGWMLLARTESGLGHWDKSAEAYRHVLELAPDRAGPSVQVAYGETLTLAAQGIVTPMARETFQAALVHEPANPIARFYLALADAQAGDDKSAISTWLKLAGELPSDSSMRAEIERRIQAAAQEAGIQPPKLPPAAPQTSGN
jgi:cytochrome c-type biogenesis protein CcmH